MFLFVFTLQDDSYNTTRDGCKVRLSSQVMCLLCTVSLCSKDGLIKRGAMLDSVERGGGQEDSLITQSRPIICGATSYN